MRVSTQLFFVGPGREFEIWVEVVAPFNNPSADARQVNHLAQNGVRRFRKGGADAIQKPHFRFG